MNKAIFLDRDGVLNVDLGYVYKKSDFSIIEGVIEALTFFSGIGFMLIVITNQSGIRRGLYSEEEFLELNGFMLDLFKKASIEITDVFYCPHSPADNCSCRKPKTELIDTAVAKYNIDRSASYLIGDKLTDIEAGRSAGLAKSFLVDNGFAGANKTNEVESFNNLSEIAKQWMQIK